LKNGELNRLLTGSKELQAAMTLLGSVVAFCPLNPSFLRWLVKSLSVSIVRHYAAVFMLL